MLQHLDLGHDCALPVWNDSRDSILEALRLGYQLLVHVLTTDMTQHTEYLLHDLLLRFYPQHCVYAGTPSSGAALLLTAGPSAVQHRSISPCHRAHSSKPAASVCGGRMGQTNGRLTVAETLLHILCSQCKQGSHRPQTPPPVLPPGKSL